MFQVASKSGHGEQPAKAMGFLQQLKSPTLLKFAHLVWDVLLCLNCLSLKLQATTHIQHVYLCVGTTHKIQNKLCVCAGLQHGIIYLYSNKSAKLENLRSLLIMYSDTFLPAQETI